MSEKPLWTPSPESVAAANVTAFMQRVNQRHGLALAGYHDLYQWSIDNLEAFWSEVWDFGNVIAQQRGERVLADGDKMPGARFFPDAKLNFAENLLLKRDDSDAIVFWGEDKVRRHLTRNAQNRQAIGPVGSKFKRENCLVQRQGLAQRQSGWKIGRQFEQTVMFLRQPEFARRTQHPRRMYAPHFDRADFDTARQFGPYAR